MTKKCESVTPYPCKRFTDNKYICDSCHDLWLADISHKHSDKQAMMEEIEKLNKWNKQP